MSTLEKVLRYIVLGGIFCLPFVPLIVADGVHFPYNLFFPYITGKNFTFRFLVEIMTGAYIALALLDAKYRPRRNWISAAFALFVILIAISDAQGVNPFKSFWSNFERMEGWVTLIHVFAYTFVTAAMMRTERLWRWLFWVSLGVSVYLSVYGFLQVAGFTALGEGGAAGLGARIDATFGNPIYLAAYLLFHIFIAAMLWAQQWGERRVGERLPISLGYGFVIVLDTMALLFTGTRGTMIGLAGGAVIAAALLLWQSNNSKLTWRISVGTLAVIFVMAAGIFVAKDAAWTHKIGFVERLATISLQDNTVKARFLNWGIAWQGVKERPVFGWGQENYAIVFDKYYDPRMYAQEPWFDRVHNIVFDWLVAGGFVGLISYLSIFAAAIYTLWRKGFTPAERAILTGLLAAYFCHNFFVFDNITSYILFGTILAYIAYRSTEANDARLLWQRDFVSENTLPYVALVCALLVWGTAWGVNAKALAQNRILLSALAQQEGGVEQNFALFKQAIDIGSYGTQEAREQLSQGTSQVIGAKSLPDSIKQEFVQTSVSEMQKQANASPLDARFPLFMGVTLDEAGDYVDAKAALERAHELSPKKQAIYFELAQNAMLRGDSKAALDDFKTAYELDTDDTDALFYYAAALITAGQEAQAQELLQPLVASGQAADQRILAAYVQKKEYAKAIPLWIAKIKAHPEDIQSYFTLAAIYYEAGDKQNAINALEAAKQVAPGVASQADPLIQQIKNGTVQVQ